MKKNRGFTPTPINKLVELKKSQLVWGFTLIELMLVVIIIGVLASMVIPRLAGKSKLAKISAAKADINANISTALDLFEVDADRYPTTQEGLNALIIKPAGEDLPNWSGPYLKRKPLDPWAKLYNYISPGVHNPDYDLYSSGPDTKENTEDDIKNWEE